MDESYDDDGGDNDGDDNDGDDNNDDDDNDGDDNDDNNVDDDDCDDDDNDDVDDDDNDDEMNDVREPPVKFDPISQPWLELKNLKQYSLDLTERRRQRLEEDILEKLKKTFENDAAHKFVIFVDGNTTKVIRKDLADKLLTWAKGKIKLKATKPAEFNPFSENVAKSSTKTTKQSACDVKDDDIEKEDKDTESTSINEDTVYLDKQGLIQIYPSTVADALRHLDNQRVLGPVEMRLMKEKELLKRDPIIAPDGYIPNSIIRGRIKPKKYAHEIPIKKTVEKPFKLKPVPKVNPHHMPSWWGKEEETETTVSDWDDLSPETAESRRSQYKGYTMLDLGPSDTNISDISGPDKLTPKFKAGTPTMYKSTSDISRVSSGTMTSVKSKRIEMTRYDLEMGTPDSMRKGRRSGTKSGQKEKSFKLTNYAVDEDSSAIRPKETKSGRRTRGQGIIKQLMEESWMPSIDGDYDDDDVFSKLISVLDNDNPVIYDSVCNYLTDIFSELGLGEDLLDDALGKLGNNLQHANTAIRRYSIKTMQVLGQGRTDILPLLLPKLVDPEEPIRKSAAKAIQLLTGATSKETLLNVLEEMGIVTSSYYNSKEDEELAFAILAERFAEPDDPLLFDRIQNWVEGTTPGLYEEDRDDDLPSWSRKESSFMSEGGKSAVYDASGFNSELPPTPASLSENSEYIFSREISLNDPKSATAKNHYNARLELLNRGGASNVPGERQELPTPPTPLSDIVTGLPLRGQSGFMDDPLTNFEQDPLLSFEPDPLLTLSVEDERLLRETSNLTHKNSLKSPDNIFLKERTLTDLSQVGPLPHFDPRDNSGRNIDDISTDSAFESARSVSEYATSHFSEKWNMSHADIQSSKFSQMSEENNMFDVEQVSNLDYEGEDIESGKKESPVTPRSRGTGFKKKLPDIDGFSTVSERSSSSRRSRGSGRFTPRDPKLYKYYNNQHQDEISRKRIHKETDEDITQKDSDYRTMSDVTNSQINDRLSGFDSGITHDVSEYSHGRHYGKEHGVSLSPVKSEPTSPSPKSTKDWRKFFDMVPTAHERKQMEQIRKEMEEGKLRHTTLPPITYFAEDLPMLPGEAGTRLLQTVRVGEKMQLPGDGRHRIESVPGKLQVHTQNEDAGLSNYGILQMQWTTGVPTVKDRLQPPQRIPQYRNQHMIRSEPSSNSSLHRRQQMISEDEELHLPFIGSNTPSVMSGHSGNHYEWEYPLPPPPAKESRTCIPHIRKDHDSYCKYYNLIKKKLHLYTSKLGFIPAVISTEKCLSKSKQQREKTQTLPEVFVKRLREPDGSGKPMTRSHDRLNRKRTLTKTDMKSTLMFPPIKLGQLVKIF
ncbi:WD repeat-containing protein 87 [Mactra antiquata]